VGQLRRQRPARARGRGVYLHPRRWANEIANADPNRVVPLDVLRDLEREGRIGGLHGRYFVTVGSSCTVENARRFGREIAARLREAGVDGVILTAT
jgi:glycine reductase